MAASDQAQTEDRDDHRRVEHAADDAHQTATKVAMRKPDDSRVAAAAPALLPKQLGRHLPAAFTIIGLAPSGEWAI